MFYCQKHFTIKSLNLKYFEEGQQLATSQLVSFKALSLQHMVQNKSYSKMDIMEIDESELKTHTIQARFVSDAGEEAGPPIDLPITVDVQQLELICNALLKNVRKYLFSKFYFTF